MKSGNGVLYFILGILVVGMLGIGYNMTSQSGLDDIPGSPEGTASNPYSCADDKDYAIVFDVQNAKNDTGAETFDAEYTFKSIDGTDTQRGTDTTAGSDTLICGKEYEFTIESADGASGDNSKIISIIEAQDGATITADGNLKFRAVGTQGVFTVGVAQHATLEAKAYDLDAAGWMCNSDDTCTDFEAEGVTFESTTNATAKALTNAGDFLNMRLDVRAVQVDTEFCDMGCLIAVEAPVTEYDEPTVRFNNKLLSDIKNVEGKLNGNEGKQLSGYEYVYEVPAGEEITHVISQLNFYIEANADASTDLQIDLLARGKVDSIVGGKILTTTAQDDSSATTLYAVQDFTIDIS